MKPMRFFCVMYAFDWVMIQTAPTQYKMHALLSYFIINRTLAENASSIAVVQRALPGRHGPITAAIESALPRWH